MSRDALYYAADIHGSERCWRKFLNAARFYQADVLIMGDDVTGKVLVPLVWHKGGWVSEAQSPPNREEPRIEDLIEPSETVMNPENRIAEIAGGQLEGELRVGQPHPVEQPTAPTRSSVNGSGSCCPRSAGRSRPWTGRPAGRG